MMANIVTQIWNLSSFKMVSVNEIELAESLYVWESERASAFRNCRPLHCGRGGSKLLHQAPWSLCDRYPDFRKTSNIHIVLSEIHPTSWRVRTFQYAKWRSSFLRKWFSLPIWHLSHWTGRSKRVASLERRSLMRTSYYGQGSLVMFLRWVAHRGPQSRRRCI